MPFYKTKKDNEMEIDQISFTPHPEFDGWFVGKTQGSATQLEERATTINDRRKARGYFAICGCLPNDDQHRLYLVPDNDPIQIARNFEVGIHGGEQEEAIEQISLVHEQNPIVPFFADPAGFKFKNAITDDFIGFLEATLSAGMEEQMINEDGELNVRETGFVHLWWD